MVLEKEIPVFLDWIGWAAVEWLVVLGILVAVAIVFGLLFSILRRGPIRGTTSVANAVGAAVVDVFCMSPRRIAALAWLAVKEAIRKKVVVGVAVFIVVLMLAGWFLDPGSTNPGRLYLSFVMTATSYLVLLLALFLSVFSLPGDMKTKTLHTIVTKPVRHSEVILGRVIGFTLVCTVLLVLMGGMSYLFVVRGLSHQHNLTAADLQPVSGESNAGEADVPLVGNTSKKNSHRHEVYVDPSGATRVRQENGHTHAVTIEGSGDTARYRIGPPEGVLVARVPIRGTLRFRDPQGLDKNQGINVGDEWFYRSYIQGGSDAAAIWTFTGLKESNFPGDRLPLEMTLGVFRTHKGEITREVTGGLSLRNPDTGLTVEIEIFDSKEFITQKLWIPKQIIQYSNRQMVSQRVETPQGIFVKPAEMDVDHSLAQKTEFDLFKDLVTPDGRVEIWLQCLEPGQHFGAAQPDLYLRAGDASVALNFVKGFYGIWLQVVIVTSFGVMFSTFLSGAVAMVATIGVLIAGFFTEFLSDLGRGEVIGGGPFEAFRRLVNQDNVMSELTPGLGTDMVVLTDRLFQPAMRIMGAILPPFDEFGCAGFVANGFDIPADFILTRTVTALAFFIPLFIIGYLFLRNREVAR
jgi:ABC-type transport system involved in multi-copper enzyme maturation permease subunit